MGAATKSAISMTRRPPSSDPSAFVVEVEVGVVTPVFYQGPQAGAIDFYQWSWTGSIDGATGRAAGCFLDSPGLHLDVQA